MSQKSTVTVELSIKEIQYITSTFLALLDSFGSRWARPIEKDILDKLEKAEKQIREET